MTRIDEHPLWLKVTLTGTALAIVVALLIARSCDSAEAEPVSAGGNG